MIEARTMSSMYAQIVVGVVPKEQSQYVTDAESAAMWDQISQEVEEIRASDPNAVFSIPNEMPDAVEEPDAGAPPEGEGPTEPGGDNPVEETVEPSAPQTGATDGQDTPPADQGGTTPPTDTGGQA